MSKPRSHFPSFEGADRSDHAPSFSGTRQQDDSYTSERAGPTVGKRNDNRHHRRITTEGSDRRGILLSVCAAAGGLRRVLRTHPTHRLRQCRANGAEHHGARTALSSGHRQNKYENPQSTPVAAPQPPASGPSPTERRALTA